MRCSPYSSGALEDDAVLAHCQVVRGRQSILVGMDSLDQVRTVFLHTDDVAGAAELERLLAPHVVMRSWSAGATVPDVVLRWRASGVSAAVSIPEARLGLVELGDVSPALAALRALPRIESWREAELVESLPFAAFVCERGSLRVLVANAEAARLYLTVPDWFLGRSLHDLRAEGQARRLGGRSRSDALRSANGVRHRRSDGTEVVVALHEAPASAMRCIVLVHQEGKDLARRAVHDLGDALGNPVLVFDVGLRVLRANAAALELIRSTQGGFASPLKPVWCDAEGRNFRSRGHPAVRALDTRRAVKGAVVGIRAGAKATRWFRVDAVPRRARGEQVVVLSAVEVTDQVAERERVQRELDQARMLLSEMRHRMRNNLQLVRSLAQVQARACGDARTRVAFLNLEQRVAAMAVVHERLSGLESSEGCDIEPHIRELAQGILVGAGDVAGRVRLCFRTEPVVVRSSATVPIALVLNELVHNALKHGFQDGAAGTITVELQAPRADEPARLVVRDDGATPTGIVSRAGSLGVRLVRALARQLGGQVTWMCRNGVTAVLTFSAIRASKGPH